MKALTLILIILAVVYTVIKTVVNNHLGYEFVSTTLEQDLTTLCGVVFSYCIIYVINN